MSDTVPPRDPTSRPARAGEGQEPPRAGRGRGRSLVLLLVWVLGLGGLIALVATSPGTKSAPSPKVVPYATFLSEVSANQVKSVDINQASGAIDGTYRKHDVAFSTQGPPGALPASDVALLNEHHVARDYVAPSNSDWSTVLFLVVPLALLLGVWVLVSRRTRTQFGAAGSWSKSKAKVHTTERPSTTFADVAGYEAVKREISELVEFLKDPERFRSAGARIPAGVLLVGPPGTGKTMLARAVAGEAGVAFITITGSEFMEMFVGVGAARVRDLFETARQNKPSIVFVDEIDAIGRKRGTGLGGGHDEREQTLNQLLAEMDGFEPAEGIIVMAATNRPDILDPALLRAGRFDRQVVVPLPTLGERRQILEVHCRDKHLAGDVDLDLLARGTPGMSGAELENLVNEAALLAVRRGSTAISGEDVEGARDKVLMGLHRSLALSPEEKRIVAVHEAGHAVVAELLEHADPVHKVTILPTGMALGATQQLPAEERQLEQRPYLDDSLAVLLGGRAAEELVFGMASTGAQNDLSSATELASRMVREWGMSEGIGKMAWAPRGPVFLGEELVHTRDYSDETARVIDQEVARILEEQSARAGALLAGHRSALEAVAGALAARETLEGAAVMALIHQAEQPLPELEAPRDDGVRAVSEP